jgi:hypothetical protein
MCLVLQISSPSAKFKFRSTIFLIATALFPFWSDQYSPARSVWTGLRPSQTTVTTRRSSRNLFKRNFIVLIFTSAMMPALVAQESSTSRPGDIPVDAPKPASTVTT